MTPPPPPTAKFLKRPDLDLSRSRTRLKVVISSRLDLELFNFRRSRLVSISNFLKFANLVSLDLELFQKVDLVRSLIIND